MRGRRRSGRRSGWNTDVATQTLPPFPTNTDFSQAAALLRDFSQRYMIDGSHWISESIRVPVACVASILMGLIVYMMLARMLTNPTQIIVRTLVQMIVVATFAVDGSAYMASVGGVLWSMADEYVAVMSGGAFRDTAQLFDQGTSTIDELAARIKEVAAGYSFWDRPIWWYLGGIAWSFGHVVLALAGLNIEVTRLLQSFVIAVGPLFIAFILLPATRQWFNNWVNVNAALVGKYLLYSMLGTSLVVSFTGAAQHAIANPSAGWPMLRPMLLLGVTMLIALPNLSAIASALFSGVPVSMMGAPTVMGRMARSGMNQVSRVATAPVRMHRAAQAQRATSAAVANLVRGRTP